MAASRELVRLEVARLFVTGAVRMVGTTVGWNLYEVVQKPRVLGIASLLQGGVFAIALLPLGTLSDRFPRRRVFLIGLAALALSYLAMAVAVHTPHPVAMLLATLPLVGLARAATGPASQALLVSLADGHKLQSAIATNAAVRHSALIGAPIIAGLIYGFWHRPEIIYLLSCACVVLGMLLVPSVIESEERTTERLVGIRSLFRDPIVFWCLALDMIVTLFASLGVLPAITRDILSGGPATLGLLRACGSAGALASAVILARRPIRRHVGRALFLSLGMYGVATIAIGAVPVTAVVACALFFVGAANMASGVVRLAILYERTAPESRGRMSALKLLTQSLADSMGDVETAFVAERIGLGAAIVVGGTVASSVAGGIALARPQLRKLDRPTD